MSDDALINKLRLELKKANAIFASPETHGLMERTLGTVWDMAVQTWGDKRNAAEFLLNENELLEGKSPFDIAVSGADGHQRVIDHIGRIQHGIHV